MTVLLILIVSFFIFTGNGERSVVDYSYFEVRIEDSLVISGSLAIDSFYSIDGKVGELQLQCDKSVVRVVRSNCRHRICMKQRVRSTGGTIICVPNRVVVECFSEDEELDFIVQ